MRRHCKYCGGELSDSDDGKGLGDLSQLPVEAGVVR